jgi:hypothetical protein
VRLARSRQNSSYRRGADAFLFVSHHQGTANSNVAQRGLGRGARGTSTTFLFLHYNLVWFTMDFGPLWVNFGVLPWSGGPLYAFYMSSLYLVNGRFCNANILRVLSREMFDRPIIFLVCFRSQGYHDSLPSHLKMKSMPINIAAAHKMQRLRHFGSPDWENNDFSDMFDHAAWNEVPTKSWT